MAAEAGAELRTRAQSWASPPATRGWLSRCGRRPRQTGPWGQRRSACRPRTGSRRAQTGPRWKAGGSGGGTRGRCSRGRPGGAWGGLQSGTPASRAQGPRGLPGSHPAVGGGTVPRGGLWLSDRPASGPPPRSGSRPAWGHSVPWGWPLRLPSVHSHPNGCFPALHLGQAWPPPVTTPPGSGRLLSIEQGQKAMSVQNSPFGWRPWAQAPGPDLFLHADAVLGVTPPYGAQDGRGRSRGGRGSHTHTHTRLLQLLRENPVSDCR